MTATWVDFGQSVATLRKKKKMSVSEVADYLGVSDEYIEQVEAGWLEPPHPIRIIAYAEALSLTPKQTLDLLVTEAFIQERIWIPPLAEELGFERMMYIYRLVTTALDGLWSPVASGNPDVAEIGIEMRKLLLDEPERFMVKNEEEGSAFDHLVDEILDAEF